MSEKRMIFHMPEYIDVDRVSGSSIRPVKMMEAFESIGYEAEVITGYGKERQQKINDVKKKIINGTRYEFMYSESSTMPTLLTEKHHLPTYPTLDYSFLKFCKYHNIKIGLFYRDIHWRFEHYKVNYFKKIIAKCFYFYDLLKYKQLVDYVYIPSLKMDKYIPCRWTTQEVGALPPAINFVQSNSNFVKKDGITIFYVGGIGDLYKLHNLFEAIHSNPCLKLIACFRRKEWCAVKHEYEKYLNDRIKIIHQSGKEIEKYYYMADLVNLFVEPIEYWKFAMPVKLFEYLGSMVPIIATKGTAAGDFVEENDIGWTVDYDIASLNNLLAYIINNKQILQQKSANMKNIISLHTWAARAKQVEWDLKNLETK